MRNPSRSTPLVLGLGVLLLCSGCSSETGSKAIKTSVGVATFGTATGDTSVKVNVPGVKVQVGSEAPPVRSAPGSEPVTAVISQTPQFTGGNTASGTASTAPDPVTSVPWEGGPGGSGSNNK